MTRQLHGKGLLFDMDGTLLDSRNAVETAWLQWSALEAVEFGDPESAHGRTAREILAERVPADRLDASLLRLVQLEETPSAPIPVLGGAADLLRDLPSERWAIVTSSAGSVARARLAHAGLQPPAVLVTADDVKAGKPDPEPYIAGARSLGLEPYECIAFEDARAGLISARRAGCLTVAITGGRPLTDIGAWADVYVESLASVSVEIRGDELVVIISA